MDIKRTLLNNSVGRSALHGFSRFNTLLFRKTNGRLGNNLPNPGGPKLPVGLLTTTGRKSGLQRTVPLLYLEDGNDVVLVASQGGSPGHPAWYLNIATNPVVTFQVAGGAERTYTCRTANDAERDVLWPRLVAMYSSFADYQSWTDRKIPVVVGSPT